MDGRMTNSDGWIDGWTDEWMDESMDGLKAEMNKVVARSHYFKECTAVNLKFGERCLKPF